MKFSIRHLNKEKNLQDYYKGTFIQEVLDGNIHNIIEMNDVVELVAWIDGLGYGVDLKGDPRYPDYLFVTIDDRKQG